MTKYRKLFLMAAFLCVANALSAQDLDSADNESLIDGLRYAIGGALVLAQAVCLWIGLPKIIDGAKTLDRGNEGLTNIISGALVIAVPILVYGLFVFFGFGSLAVNPADVIGG